MRARLPDHEAFVERDGVKIRYEIHGDADVTILLLPTWSVVHARAWKMQIPYLSRHFRVVTFDGRGNGGSDRPPGPEAYAVEEFVDDAVAVLDAAGVDRCVVVAVSIGACRALGLAADHPERVLGAVSIAPAIPAFGHHPDREGIGFTEVFEEPKGWQKFTADYWKRDYRDFLEFFFSEAFTEPHSTKAIEDTVAWGLETTPETLIDTILAPAWDLEQVLDRCRRVRCPVLVVHGREDRIRPYAHGVRLAEETGGELVTIEGGGHLPEVRDPARVNLLLRSFAERVGGRHVGFAHTWTRGLARRKRALYLSSPIGLGHGRRDLAIARELREHHPDLEVDWLAQHPVTAMLDAEGERVHPASDWLASESAHIASESGEHDLHCFQALRRMDEILCANFMVFQEAVEEGDYDLVIADEAWDVDHFWHEHPELKRSALAWMTDFVGYVPMGSGGAREAFLTADYNAEMIEHVGRYPRVRDRAVFVGDPEDIVPQTFGPDLPGIREWTEAHFAFAGYVTGYDPAALGDREELRAELGYGADEVVCIVTVGGSGVGGSLLRRVIAAYPAAARAIDGLRMIAVAGPRIDPAQLPSHPGLEVRGYVHGLHRHLAACDIAVVQGGLTTTMELVASRRPFLYFPLRDHFEQNVHVRYRLDRYGAGRCMDYAAAEPDAIAEAMALELARDIDYRPVRADGAARAAALIADLL